MAKYLGLLSADARGKIGGIIMSRAQGATTLKGHRKPKHPSSLAQQQHQGRMGAALSRWRTLTPTQQQSWVSFAANTYYTNSLGTGYSPTALQLYTQAYINAAYNGSIPPATIPSGTALPPSIFSMTAIRSGGVLEFFANSISGPYSGEWYLFASSVISPSQNYVRTTARKFIDVCSGGYSGDVSSFWLAAYGTLPPVNSRVAVRVLPVNSVAFISGAQLIVPVTIS